MKKLHLFLIFTLFLNSQIDISAAPQYRAASNLGSYALGRSFSNVQNSVYNFQHTRYVNDSFISKEERKLYKELSKFFKPSFNQKLEIKQNEKGLYGIAESNETKKTKWVVKPDYLNIVENPYGFYAVCNKKNKWGIFTAFGTKCMDFEYNNEMVAFNVLDDKLMGLFKEYNILSQRGKSEIREEKEGHYGVFRLDKDNWLIKPTLTSITQNNYGSYTVSDQHGKWGIYDLNGALIISCRCKTGEEAEAEFKKTGLRAMASQWNGKEFESGEKNKMNVEDIPGAVKKNGVIVLTGSPEEILEDILEIPPTVAAQCGITPAYFTLTRDYSDFIKTFVEFKVNRWQQKGEFEKTSDYQARVTVSTRNDKINQCVEEANSIILKQLERKPLKMTLGEYDADNETFLVKSRLGDFILPVTLDDAQIFKSEWPTLTTDIIYRISNGKIFVDKAVFKNKFNTINTAYDYAQNVTYSPTNITYNFDPIEIPSSEESPGAPMISRNDISVGKSDVDVNIPSGSTVNENTFALIFSNENYREEAPVIFAKNDGVAVKNYFETTLGLPQNNIHLVENATKNDMIREIDWIKTISEAFGDNVNLLIYYSGHGVPEASTGDAYLIPVDGVARNTKTLYKLGDFYSDLASINSNSTILFLDACFSGAARGNDMLAYTRGVALKHNAETPTKNMIVLTAASEAETAWPYLEKNHGLFTYFLLKKLQESKGEATIGQLAEYVRQQVGRQSLLVHSVKQTPTLLVSPQMSQKWETLKLK